MPPSPSLTDRAAEAWLYLYPLVLMHTTALSEPRLERNIWLHAAASPDHRAKRVIRPNLDTVYSHAWLALSAGPVSVDMPDLSSRYCVIQAMDVWSQTFAAVGSRMLDRGACRVAFALPEHLEAARCALPAETLLMSSPSRAVWLLMRIQRLNGDTAESGGAWQRQFAIDSQPLEPAPKDNAFFDLAAPAQAAPLIAQQMPPPKVLYKLSARGFFSWAKTLLQDVGDDRLPFDADALGYGNWQERRWQE